MSADQLPDLAPVMLSGLTWPEALAALGSVDCAVRRPHWCSPVVILHEGRPTLDDDGDLTPFTKRVMGRDRYARDWHMVPRCDDNGDKVVPTLRAPSPAPGDA